MYVDITYLFEYTVDHILTLVQLNMQEKLPVLCFRSHECHVNRFAQDLGICFHCLSPRFKLPEHTSQGKQHQEHLQSVICL